MGNYKYTAYTDGGKMQGEVDASTPAEAQVMVQRLYEGVPISSITIDETDVFVERAPMFSEETKDNILAGLGCLGAGAFSVLWTALPIAVAVLIVLFVLRSC